eukprot:569415-Rhodomonas_salina.2
MAHFTQNSCVCSYTEKTSRTLKCHNIISQSQSTPGRMTTRASRRIWGRCSANLRFSKNWGGSKTDTMWHLYSSSVQIWQRTGVSTAVVACMIFISAIAVLHTETRGPASTIGPHCQTARPAASHLSMLVEDQQSR